MTHRTISLLFLALLVLPCFAASKYESKITSLEGEKWWGGAVGLGRLDRVVRILGGRRMSVSGIIENIVRHHLSLYEEDFEAWRKL